MVGDDQPGTGLEEVWTPLQAAAIADSLDDQVVKTSCSYGGMVRIKRISFSMYGMPWRARPRFYL